MKLKKDKTRRKTRYYDFGEYTVMITETEDMFHAWMVRKNNGIASSIFGCPKQQTLYGKSHIVSFKEFKTMVEANLNGGSYITFYEDILEYLEGREI